MSKFRLSQLLPLLPKYSNNFKRGSYKNGNYRNVYIVDGNSYFDLNEFELKEYFEIPYYVRQVMATNFPSSASLLIIMEKESN